MPTLTVTTSDGCRRGWPKLSGKKATMTGSGTTIRTDANDVIVGSDGADTINGAGDGNDSGRDLIAGDSFSVGANAISSSRAPVPERDLPRYTQKGLCSPIEKVDLVWLDEVADRSGLTAGFSQVLASAPRRRHAPGVTLV